MGRAGQNWLLRPSAYSTLIPPIGVTPAVLWDARQGVDDSGPGGTVISWTDLIRGLVLTPPTTAQRPIYGTASGEFLGRKIVKFDGTDDVMRVGPVTPAILPSGTRGHWFYVARRVIHTVNQITMWIVLNEPVTAAVPMAYFASSSTNLVHSFAPGQATTGPGVSGGVAHLFELWVESTQTSTALDGAAPTSVPDGTATTSAAQSFYLGADHTGNHANLYVAAWGCYAAALTAPQRVALASHYTAAFGVP